MTEALRLPATSAAPPAAFTVRSNVRPRSQWFGWVGVLVVVAWTGLARLMSSTDVEAIAGPVRFGWVALALLVGMVRWPPVHASPFARLGGVTLLAWLLTSFTSVYLKEREGDPWLLQVVETFQYNDNAWHFGVVALGIALVSRCTPRREMWVLGPLAVGATSQGQLPAAFVVAVVWWGGRVMRGRVSWRWTLAMLVVVPLVAIPETRFFRCHGTFWGALMLTIALGAALVSSPKSVAVLGGRGTIWGDVVALPVVALTAMVIVCEPSYAIAIVVLLSAAAAVALWRRQAERAVRLWATMLGFSFRFALDGFTLDDASSVGDAAPLLALFLFFGPRARWSPVLWGSACAGQALMAEFGAGEGRWISGVVIVVVATVGFALIRHTVCARTRR